MYVCMHVCIYRKIRQWRMLSASYVIQMAFRAFAVKQRVSNPNNPDNPDSPDNPIYIYIYIYICMYNNPDINF